MVTVKEITSNHKLRWSQAIDEFGDKFLVPIQIVAKINDANKGDWEEHNKSHRETPSGKEIVTCECGWAERKTPPCPTSCKVCH